MTGLWGEREMGGDLAEELDAKPVYSSYWVNLGGRGRSNGERGDAWGRGESREGRSQWDCGGDYIGDITAGVTGVSG